MERIRRGGTIVEAVAVSVASDTVLGDLSGMVWKREFTKIMVQGEGGEANDREMCGGRSCFF